ncbi:HIT family protein [Rhodococcus gannanensis]|uniref:HIT family protein n=1 Tax=Rhodococcus gannanensis TaxID=1960308 RepID=A0ABW4P8A4_9NOCA
MAGCVFCDVISGAASAHRVWEDDATVAFLDRRPVFHGHVLLVPRMHVETLGDLPQNQLTPLFGVAQRISTAVVEALGAQGSFVAMNNVVSQSVPHLHVHVVPRTKGDGLRGFFWPRTTYADDAEAAGVARTISRALESSATDG